SLWAPDDPTQPHHRPADHPHEHLVVNEAEAVAHFLTSLKHEPRATPPCVDCLLDNAGFELLGDLCLADYLLSTAQVQTVRVHAKLHPTFVSDAIMVDVHAPGGRWTGGQRSCFVGWGGRVSAAGRRSTSCKTS